MILHLYIVPLAIALCSTIYFKKSKVYVLTTLEYNMHILLEVATIYSFIMIFLNRIATLNVTLSVLFAFIFLTCIIIKYMMNREEDDDLIIVYETFKNNLMIQMTSYVPFLLFMYVFRDLNSMFVIVLVSIMLSAALFTLSLLANIHKLRFTEFILSKLQFKTTLGVISGLVVATLIVGGIFGFFIKTLGKPISSEETHSFEFIVGYEENEYFEWDEVEFVDSNVYYNTNSIPIRSYLIVKDQNNMEYFVKIYTNLALLKQTFDVYPIAVNDIDTQSFNWRINRDTGKYITSPKGLYYFDQEAEEVKLVAGTENKSVSVFFDEDNYECFLVKEDDNKYTLLDNDLNTITTYTDSEFLVIGNQLFKVDTVNSTYIRYYDETEVYDIKEDMVPYYDAKSNTLYQLKTVDGVTTMQVNNETHDVLLEKNTGKGLSAIPLLDGTLYNERQFSYQDKEYNLTDDLKIYSMKQDNDVYYSMLVYDEANYHVDYRVYSMITVLSKTEIEGTKVYDLSTFNFEKNNENLAFNMQSNALHFGFFVVLAFFVPISDNEKYIILEKFEKEEKKK